jgi:hypothetical protein
MTTLLLVQILPSILKKGKFVRDKQGDLTKVLKAIKLRM